MLKMKRADLVEKFILESDGIDRLGSMFPNEVEILGVVDDQFAEVLAGGEELKEDR